MEEFTLNIVSNVMHDELYEYSKSFYDSMRYEKTVVSGKNGMYGFEAINHVILNKELYNFDWMVYVDEDCFITDLKALEDLIQYQTNNDYSCSGVPDGGVISHRFHNPIAINPFFMVMNVGEIREKYDAAEVSLSFYAPDLDKYIPTTLMKTESSFAYDNFEYCYNFFFWLLRNNFKILYLDAGEHTDNLTTIVKNQDGIPFAYHTWFARKWSTRPQNRKRIKSVIEYCNKIKSVSGG